MEEALRRKKPIQYSPDKETVLDTLDSIRAAEKIVGHRMPSPTDPDQIRKMIAADNGPEYHFAEDDEEDHDTLETRKSVKWAEKSLRHRFFINKKEERDYLTAASEGKIPEEELNFEEGPNKKTGLGVDHAKEAELEKKRQ